MSLAIINTRAQLGVNAPEVTVETHISNGLPALSIVGMPETAVKESRERVRSALINSGFEFPTRRITINLAPADLPKQGGRYDLAIALSILVASGQLPENCTENYEFIGELALTGDIRAVSGVLPTTQVACRDGHSVIVPEASQSEVALLESKQVYVANHLTNVCLHLLNKKTLECAVWSDKSLALHSDKDMSEVKGQYQARRALEVAASARHNLFFYGPPGTGKSMLASRLPTILPELSAPEAIEVASLYSLSGKQVDISSYKRPPYRSPHHTASAAALVGGGSNPLPGEISLAHLGVLFLDELPEFGRKVLEVLREPLESREVNISRAKNSMTYPADVQIIAAMNPCPCGFLGHPTRNCTCSPPQIANYRNKLSGPLLDRFDMHVEVTFQSGNLLLNNERQEEGSGDILERVLVARDRQLKRQNKLNSQLSSKEIGEYCRLSADLSTKLEHAMDRLCLSARAAHRVLKVARTLADMEGLNEIRQVHLNEALSYRGLDRSVK